MKNIVRKISTILFVFFMFLMLLNINTITSSSYVSNYLSTSTSPEKINELLLGKVLVLENYAKSYIQETGVSTSSTELSMHFIRKNSYSSGLWKILLGDIDQNFVDYVLQKNPSLNFKTSEVFYDLRTGKKVDFVHMMVTLNTYYRYGENALIFSSHYAGWAGDLLTLLEEEINYKEKNSVTDKKLLSDYVNNLLATNASSSFNTEDAYADIDAYNISKIANLRTNLTDTLKHYYTSDVENENNYYNRFITFRKLYGDSQETLRTQATNLLSSKFVAKYLIPDTYSKINSADVSIVVDEFVNYIFGKVYVSVEKEDYEVVVGDSLNIKLIEKNALESNAIKYDNNKLNVSLNNSILNVRTLEVGESTIDFYSQGKILLSLKINVKNVKPAIESQPKVSGTFTEGDQMGVSFKANGTNNKYKWYIFNSSSLESNYVLVGETSVPNLNLKLKASYNNKYLRCQVSNDGNVEVFTNPIKLSVNKLPVQEEIIDKKEELDDSSNVFDDDVPKNDSNINNDDSEKKPALNNSGDNKKPTTNNSSDNKKPTNNVETQNNKKEDMVFENSKNDKDKETLSDNDSTILEESPDISNPNDKEDELGIEEEILPGFFWEEFLKHDITIEDAEKHVELQNEIKVSPLKKDYHIDRLIVFVVALSIVSVLSIVCLLVRHFGNKNKKA